MTLKFLWWLIRRKMSRIAVLVLLVPWWPRATSDSCPEAITHKYEALATRMWTLEIFISRVLPSFISETVNRELNALRNTAATLRNLTSASSEECPACPPLPETPTAFSDSPTTLSGPARLATPEAMTRMPSNCFEHLQVGHAASGIYSILPKHYTIRVPIQVYCDMETDGGGWIVVQRRARSAEQTDFDLYWEDYKAGFGNLSHEFWLGNDYLFALTNQERVSLRIDLEDWQGERRHAIYRQFVVASEGENYKATLWKYSGDAGDAMTEHANGTAFSTRNRDNDRFVGLHCARHWRAGWWYGWCHDANLNGVYARHADLVHNKGITWSPWKGPNYSLKSSEMKLRPV